MLVITVEGGLVQSVSSPDPEIIKAIGDIVVLDYDIEGTDEEELVTVKYKTDPVTAQAAAHIVEPDETIIDTENLMNQIIFD